MGKCIECARFPWVPGADYSMLPPMKCAKELEARRWTKETAALEHNCPYYHGQEAVKDNDTDTGTQDKVEEVTGRKNSRRRK
jgi:hypothetical protein